MMDMDTFLGNLKTVRCISFDGGPRCVQHIMTEEMESCAKNITLIHSGCIRGIDCGDLPCPLYEPRIEEHV